MTAQPSRGARRKGFGGTANRWSLSAALLALASLLSTTAKAQSPAVCVVSGTVLDGGSNPIVGTVVRFRVVSPVLATTGAALATQDLTTTTTAGGAWSLTLVQGLNAQVDIPAVGIAKDTVIPTGASCPALFSALTLYNRGTLVPATILSTTGPSMGGDLTGSSPNPTVVGLRGQTLAAGACTNGQARVYSSGSSSYTCQSVTTGTSVTSITGGTGISVTGTATVPIVGITAGSVTNTQLGTGAAAANLGAAGGALTGTYPSPTLATGVAATNVGALGGDLSGTLPSPSVATVGGQTAANVAAGAVLANAATTANTPSTIVKRDGGGAFTAGNITGTFLGNATTATTLSSTLTGDASSSGNAVTVTGLRGRPVNVAAPTNGQALTWSGTDWAPASAIGTVTSVSAAGGGTGLSFSGSPITGAGTLTLQGTLGVGFGGTGQTSPAAAFDALDPLTTVGDILYEGTGPTAARLAGNNTTTNQFLRSTGSGGLATAPTWSTLVSGDIPASISSNTSGTAAGLSATLVVGSGGTGQTTASGAFNALSPTTTTGDIIYANGAGTNTRLAGNTTTTKQFLTGTGTGAAAQAPAWGPIVSGDLPASIAANTSGTAAGLSSTLVVASGGSGATTFSAGVLHASGTSAFTSAPVALGSEVSGTLPVGNGGTGQATAAAAYNALSPTTTAGDFAYANGAGTNTRLAGNTTATKMFMQETSSVPSWAALVAADIPALDASKITTGTIAAAQLPALAGDVTGAPGTNSVVKIQGNNVLAGTPTNGQVYQYVTANNRFEPTTIAASPVSSVSGSGGTTGMTLGGGPTGAVTLTLGGTLGIANGGTGQTSAGTGFNALSPMTTLGDVIYGGASGAGTRLSGNTTTTPMFLRSTGSAGLATAPTFSQINAATDFVNATPVVNGGTGAATLTGLLRGNGTSAITGAATASLTSEVSGVLPVANGGTNVSSWTTGSIPYLTSTSAFAQDNANLFWDGSTHRLGLGTTTPGAGYTASGGANIAELSSANANGTSLIIAGSQTSDGNLADLAFGNSAVGTTDNRVGLLRFSRNGANNSGKFDIWTRNAGTFVDAMTILPGGNVGVGTTTPDTSASYGVSGLLAIQATSNFAVLGLNGTTGDADGTALGQVDFSAPTTTLAANRRHAVIQGALSGSTAGNRGGYIRFYTKADGGSLAERMRLDNAGNVGIGTTAPTSNLHVISTSTTVPAVEITGPANVTTGVGTLRVTDGGYTGPSYAINAIGNSNAGYAIKGSVGAGALGGAAQFVGGTSSTSPVVQITTGVTTERGLDIQGVANQTGDLIRASNNGGYAIGGLTYQGGFYNSACDSSNVGCATATQGWASELVTLNTGGTTTDTSANLLPANSVIRAVVVRVIQSITVASAFSLGDATIAARFLATGTGLAAGSTGVGLAHVDQTGTSGPRQTAAAKVRVTTTGTPGAGQVRITVFYETYAPPSS
jgi:hypothetical protein